ncbi:MAG: hypothetical protein ACRCTR_07995 [Actinomycetota bacterium]
MSKVRILSGALSRTAVLDGDPGGLPSCAGLGELAVTGNPDALVPCIVRLITSESFVRSSRVDTSFVIVSMRKEPHVVVPSV